MLFAPLTKNARLITTTTSVSNSSTSATATGLRSKNDGYNASAVYSNNPRVRRVVDALRAGFNGQSFGDIADYLTIGTNYVADPYMVLRDFDDYLRAAGEMDAAYRDRVRWNRMSLNNIAESGTFAADRSIREYADNIWHLSPVKLREEI